MNTTEKYCKDHLDDPKNRKALEHYRGYYIDRLYRKICYKNKNKVWMYARSMDSKPGFVYIYSHGQLVSVNERAIAHAILGPYIPKATVSANTIITQVITEAKKPRPEKIKKTKDQPIFNQAKRLQLMFDETI